MLRNIRLSLDYTVGTSRPVRNWFSTGSIERREVCNGLKHITRKSKTKVLHQFLSRGLVMFNFRDKLFEEISNCIGVVFFEWDDYERHHYFF